MYNLQCFKELSPHGSIITKPSRNKVEVKSKRKYQSLTQKYFLFPEKHTS